MPRVTHVKKARKDVNEKIKKGDSYYWWKFRYGSKLVSTTYPRPQQLTQSSFLITIYDLQDQQGDISATDTDELEGARDELRDAVQELLDTTQESFENIPESLQEAPSGELLTERIDSLENWVQELDDFDTDIEAEEPEEPEADIEYPELGDNATEEEKAQFDADYKEAEEAEEAHAEALKEYEREKEQYNEDAESQIQDKVSELQGIEYQG
jgi:uncharacterized protein YjbJ (UPF0337 family)